ncbi:MAG: hypothetical protein RIB53_15870 [Roseitalea porphyridii]|uniref:hypothetical protein n=1 Tax=Roseitalea porphyridii TaxID=1852022 RepID=UPI0032EE0227
MRIRAYILSVLLHVAVLLLTLTGLSLWPKEPPVPEETFTVEFGAVAELEQVAEVQAPLPEKDVPLPKAKPSQVVAAAPSAPVVDKVTASPETRPADTAPAPNIPQPRLNAERVPEPPSPQTVEAARAASRDAPQPSALADSVTTPRLSTAPEPAKADARAAETARAAQAEGGAPAEEAAPRAEDVPEAATVSASRAAPANSSKADKADSEKVAALQPVEKPQERQPEPKEPVKAAEPPKPVPVTSEQADRAKAPEPEQKAQPVKEAAQPEQQVAAVPKAPAEPQKVEPPPPDAALTEAVPRPKSRPKQLEVATAPQKTRPEPPKTEDKPKKDDLNLDRLSALLDKRLDNNADVRRDEENAAPKRSDTVVRQTRDAPLSSTPLSSSELAAIRGQFERCWNPPTGARDARDLIVVVRIWLRQDGTLQREPVVVNQGPSGDQFWRAAAESAVRAVRKCEPVQGLDPGKYDRWRDIELTFNPRDMLG